MSSSPVRFKDEIRHSFIFYALIPALIFSLVVFIATAIIWNWRLYSHSVAENKCVTELLEKEVAAYRKICSEKLVLNYKDGADLSYIYAELKNSVMEQEVEADFALLDSNFRVLLQGNSLRNLYIPIWQISAGWGALGRMKNNPDSIIVEISSDYNEFAKAEIVIGRKVKNLSDSDVFLVFMISPEKIKESLKNSFSFAITNRFARLLFASDSSYENQLNEIKVEYLRQKPYFSVDNEVVFHSSTKDKFFEVYTFSNISFIKKTFALLSFAIIIFLFLVVAGLFISARKIAEEKTLTIDKIVAACESVSKGTFTGHLAVESNIEFQTIANAFNNMLDDVHKLIEENRREVREKYTAELKQLEMQFNPHFLFNTLETIKFLVKLDPDRAQKTIVCLSELLRYSSNSGISVVPISEDLHYIENYLYILQLRFSQRFTYSVDVPATAGSCQIPKLIIQSIIGNSVKHGFKGIEQIHVSITARAISGKLIIVVQDNGAGMDKDELKKIRTILKSVQNDSGHTGLHNAQRRIKLMYGEPFGIEIKSQKNSGTRTKITLPVIR